jgi:cell division protein FtsN
MARDYAKYPAQIKKKSPQKKWRKKLLWFVFIIFVLGAIFTWLWVYKNNAWESSRKQLAVWAADLQSHLRHKKTGAVSLAKTTAAQQSAAESEVRFNFYTELPNAQVTLPESKESSQIAQRNVPTSVKKAESSSLTKEAKNSGENAGQYILQLGVFKNKAAADQLRVSLLLAGLDATIVPYVEKNKTVLYRVQRGPYAALAQIKEEQKQLENKGITGLIKAL